MVENQASNAFKPAELVKIQGRQYPVVGGRLRLAHEAGVRGITTEIVECSTSRVVIKATVFMARDGSDIQRPFNGYGEADEKRDARLKEAILELAETRAIARALRFAGFGTEFTGAEEVSHLKGRQENDDEVDEVHNSGPTGLPTRSTTPPTPAAGNASTPPPAVKSGASSFSPANTMKPNPSGGDGTIVCGHILSSGSKCGKSLDEKVESYSKKFYGQPLCLMHQGLYTKQK